MPAKEKPSSSKWLKQVIFANENAIADSQLLSTGDVIQKLTINGAIEEAWVFSCALRCVSTILDREYLSTAAKLQVGSQESLPQSHRASVGEKLVLLRQLLRLMGDGFSMAIPADIVKGKPNDANVWGLRFRSSRSNRLTVSAEAASFSESPWGSGKFDPKLFDPRAELRRRFDYQPPDGALICSTPFKSYQSKTQKEAMRAIFLAPERSVILISLPTGSGKSLFCQLPALHWTRKGNDANGKLTVMICPTLALIEDQYQAATTAFGNRNDKVVRAIGGTPDAQRQQILTRIEGGAAALVLMTPEVALGYANEALKEAARHSNIRMLVVDEVHLLETWGTKFRPAIQRLANLRRELSDLDPHITTVLLSATIKPSTTQRIQTLYVGDQDRFVFFNGSDIRNEHDFVKSVHQDAQSRENFIHRSVHKLPRPMIIYTTRVDDAEQITNDLVKVGFNRLRCFTGRTQDQDRQKIIEDWRKDRIDLVVATSAFGLGIDKADVRVVLHATIPESLDRFYQEVGRGARDGFPCLSWMTAVRDDNQLASKHALGSILTPKLLAERWLALVRDGERDVQQQSAIVWRVDLNARWKRVREQSEQSGDKNQEWNEGTLLFFERAGLINWRGVNDDGRIEIEISDLNIAPPPKEKEPAFLKELVEKLTPIREAEQDENRKSLQLVFDWVFAKDGKCAGRKFEEIYGLASSRECGRCWTCRENSVEPDLSLAQASTELSFPLEPREKVGLSHSLQRRVGNFKIGLIEYRSVEGSDQANRQLSELVGRLAQDGVQQFFCSSILQQDVGEAASREPSSLGLTLNLDKLWKDIYLHELKNIPSSAIIAADDKTRESMRQFESFVDRLEPNTRLIVILPRRYQVTAQENYPLAERLTYSSPIDASEYLSSLE